ncbi:hypothetical protein DFQ28_005495 [Apophysomyces sp. BC1034]|nr:hypothetical protein DFQ30_007431 [Apophysomyces sp. BC1015]KAG0177695.1 hypothetical protein DFQ29_004529 [Apophysomyces sp. BC1021]KAG0188008.1 hypothetical protein DFQ28_005495 [Apophysomyces sp. BC1034]
MYSKAPTSATAGERPQSPVYNSPHTAHSPTYNSPHTPHSPLPTPSQHHQGYGDFASDTYYAQGAVPRDEKTAVNDNYEMQRQQPENYTPTSPNAFHHQPVYVPPQQSGYMYTPAPVPGGPLLPVQYGPTRPLWLRLLIGPVRQAWFSWISALVMLAVLVLEFVRNYQMTGNVIQTNPINPMIGPSFTVLINLGARFTPCMRSLPNVPLTTIYPDCYRSLQDTCTLEQLCGFDGFDINGQPNQSFRLVLPIFMHAGIVHFLMNMLTHLRLGVDLERSLGIPRYVLLYMASGIWGFVLSAMFSQGKSASMGCSGALFGLIGYMLVDVFINWKVISHPGQELARILVTVIISLVLGLLPGLDNFAHVGGLAVGIVMGILIAPMRPNASKRAQFITWIVRVCALVLLIVMFAAAIKVFYSSPDPRQICPNCKYISCLPVQNWCDMS